MNAPSCFLVVLAQRDDGPRFVVLKNPAPNKKDYADKVAFRAANEEMKKQRRQDLWAFTDLGMPGEAR